MNVVHFESIDSTNLYLKNNYDKLGDLTFVSTNYQSKGSGRTKRNWYSEKNKNLLFSLLIKDRNLIDRFNTLSILSAYTIVKVLKEYGINDLSIKWPNDVYVKDDKICGILLESISKENIECLIIGVGLNVNQDNFIEDYLTTPTSIKKILSKEISVDEIKNKVYEKLLDNLNKLKHDYDFYSEIISYDYLKNKEVYALINSQKVKVKVEGINKDYSLRVNNDGETLNTNSGEISFHI